MMHGRLNRLSNTTAYHIVGNWIFICMLFGCTLYGCGDAEQSGRRAVSLVRYVDPFIGTAGKGNTYPGATVPNGMVQLSPDNGRSGWDWIPGYYYPDSIIAGFSHLHLSGTGAGDLYDISYLPVSGELKRLSRGYNDINPMVYSRFSHDREEASPGYYQVYLEDYGVNAELTATERTGLQRYRFEGGDANIRLHLGYSRNWDSITDSYLRVVNDSTIEGYRRSTGWAKDQHVYFQSVFSQPFTYQLSNDSITSTSDSIRGLNILLELAFDAEEVLVKTGLSSVSAANAAQNLGTEQTGFDFDGVRQRATDKWERRLSSVVIKAEEPQMRQFYTAMYHSMLAPTIYSDINGQYRGADGLIHTSEGYPRYTTYSLWDTYRALHPWLTLAQPDSVGGLVNSMLDFENESGLLPVWNLWGGETNMMIGYHAVPVIADALAKGITGIDEDRAYSAMRNSAMQADSVLSLYRKQGFIPHEATSWSVSKTMEYAYDDWCVAQVAQSLGRTEDANYFLNRSANYRYHFDEDTRFFRARSSNGQFKTPFDPLAYRPEDYCEANAWQYLWYVPHEVEQLVTMLGGPVSFEQRLDSLFDMPQSDEQSPDWISGYIGQYVHGNEPSHHVPYLYQYVGAPHKTQQIVRQVMDELYNDVPDGLAGNEDCGQLSAWYLFSALGFYPVNPATGEYVLGSPVVESATIYVGEDKTFKIKAENQSAENIYVKSVKLNGELLEGFNISHAQIMAGGELVFEMTDKSPSE